MKIFCAGAEGYINQISRIRDGFKELSHEIVDDYKIADLVYVNDISSFNPDYRKYNKGATIIYTVLDLAPHLVNPEKYDTSRYAKLAHPWSRNLDIEGITNKLKTECDIVCSICQDVSWQIKNWCGIDAKCIYNPIKPVKFLNLQSHEKIANRDGKLFKYLAIGRLNDFNKRKSLIISTLGVMGDSPSLLATVGSEDMGYGSHFGVISDENLNLFYNSCEYLFFPAAYKSVALPLLESIVCKQKFLICSDDPTSEEFAPGLGIEPTPHALAAAIKSPEWNEKCQKFVDDHSEEYRQKFSPQQICKNILSLL